MENIKKLINDNYLDLSTLVVFTRTEHHIHQREYKWIKENDLTTNQFGVLEALYVKGDLKIGQALYVKGDLKIGQIIESVLSTSGNMTVVVKNLEKLGLVKRIQDPNDKRSTIISLTPTGRSKIEAILPQHYKNITEIFSILTDEEKEVLKTILKKISKPL